MLTYETWEENVVSFSEEDETKGALSVLNWAYGSIKMKLSTHVALGWKVWYCAPYKPSKSIC